MGRLGSRQSMLYSYSQAQEDGTVDSPGVRRIMGFNFCVRGTPLREKGEGHSCVFLTRSGEKGPNSMSSLLIKPMVLQATTKQLQLRSCAATRIKPV